MNRPTRGVGFAARFGSRPAVFVWLICAVVVSIPHVSAQEASRQEPTVFSSADTDRERMVILDVISSSLEPSEVRLFTDVITTEVFKLSSFQIVDRGQTAEVLAEQEISAEVGPDDAELLRVGELLGADKLLVTRIENYEGTTAINTRIVDVDTSLLDFTENVFVDEGSETLDALRDMIVQIEVTYVLTGRGADGNPADVLRRRWRAVGAEGATLDYLLNRAVDPAGFLSLRQYDISFTTEEYVAVLRSGWDPDGLRPFFRQGIPYEEVEQALQLGITDLERYTQAFEPEGLSFAQYLDAYRRGMTTPERYLEYRDGFVKDQLVMGMGTVANAIPVGNADFTFFVLTVGWERYFTESLRAPVRSSMEVGTFFMNAFVPTPYLQLNAYAGSPPFYGFVGVGGLAEVFLGGHVAAYVRGGVEVAERFSFSVMASVFGNQPAISYADFETELNDPDYVEIEFPYFAAFLTYKPGRAFFDNFR